MRTAYSKLLIITTCTLSALLGIFFTGYNYKANAAPGTLNINAATGTAIIATPFTLGGVSVTSTGTELNYVDGVTSLIQPQFTTLTNNVSTANSNIALKANIASPTFTGSVTTPILTATGGAGNGVNISGTSPTMMFKDTDNRTGYWHMNSDIMYLLSGPNGADVGAWAQVGGVWPLTINTLTNTVSAQTFSGALSGNATTATNFNNGTSYSSGGDIRGTEMYASSWFRSSGRTGLYNQTPYNIHFYADSAAYWRMSSGYGLMLNSTAAHDS
ncbi:MAG: hypothetical protein Q7T74_06250, partial [Candidatus Saccharibacteria bacterium]|nr:hypothetical protein [Candidatus Saccharibacteria bacterium]